MQRLATDAGPVHRPGPQADPKFAALKADVRGKQQVLGAHPPAASEASKAQGAAKAPQDDKEAQGKAANAEKMNAAKPGEFDKAAFVRAVNEAIAAQAPKNLDEADKFGDSGKADAVKGQVQGQVTDGKKASANAIETTTKAPPDTSQAVDKPVTPLVADKPPAAPGAPDPAKAVPDKAPAAATDLSGGPKQVDQQMADAQVTEEQLAKSNEPEFTGALKEKDAVEQHTATAPGQVRAAEAQTLTGAKAAAGAAGATAMNALAGDRKQAGQSVGAGKEQAKSADEVKRAQVTATLQKVFDATKKDVEEILSGLDKKVDEKFGAGEKAARDAFTAEHTRLMDAYKDKRYSGLLGKGRWIKDKFAGLPEEANQIFVTARKGYVDRMQQVISAVADVIGAELTRAKQRIATGRDQLQAEVKKLPADLQAIGKEAAGEFAGKFDELTESVNNKGTELVQTLATKYNEALKSVDEEIAAEKEKNKGLVAKAVDAVAGVIKTIMQLKDMLMGVLAKAAQAVMAIIKDPIGFLGNLVSAVGAGLKQFMANIGEHLKKGLVGWLTGAMAGAGLELPAKFDLRGIVMMIGSLLGLTWASIRGLIIKRGVPEPAMGAVEKSVPIVQKVQAQGLGGLWEEIQDKVGDLKANLFAKISEYLIPTVLMAGITWIISLLNPASAFVRAVKMIIDFVTFIVTQGAQILEFVNSVLDAIIAIAGGGTGGVPALIEKALARSVPVLIGVLAAVLGVGGIAQRVQKFFKGLAAPVMKAVGWVADKIAAAGRKLWSKLKAGARKARASAKGLRDRLRPGRRRDGTDPRRRGRSDPDQRSSQAKQQHLEQAVKALKPALKRALAEGISPSRLQKKLAGWKAKHRLSSLSVSPSGEFTATVNPSITLDDPKGKRLTDAELAALLLPIFHEVEEAFSRETSATLLPDGSFQLRLPFAAGQRQAYAAGERNALDGLTRSEQRAILASTRPGSSSLEVEPDVVLWSNRFSWQGWQENPTGVRRIPKVQAPWTPGLSKAKRERREPGAYRPGMMAELIDRGVTEFGLSKAAIERALTTGSRVGVLSLRRQMTRGSSEDQAEYLTLLNTHNILRHGVEAGRYPGMGTTTALSSALVDTGVADHDRVVAGDLAPMAPKGAAFTGKKPVRRRDDQGSLVPLNSRYPHEHEMAERIRIRRVGRIIRELLQAATTRPIMATSSGYHLDKLAVAIRQWLAARVGHGREPAEIIDAGTRLRTELMRLMAHYDGQT
ncbi:hypothetical protein [Micromonospora sp. NBC_01412]|uniref:phage tail protein n=1 Tax=Micromonospora sp. NBC_01412 TaxID=2903590 RepID=UPI003250B450